jgi:polynucleotide 5'-kinase involved in rRNA processing
VRNGPSGWENPEAEVNEYEALVDETVTKHTALVGGLDTGKTTLLVPC